MADHDLTIEKLLAAHAKLAAAPPPIVALLVHPDDVEALRTAASAVVEVTETSIGGVRLMVSAAYPRGRMQPLTRAMLDELLGRNDATPKAGR